MTAAKYELADVAAFYGDRCAIAVRALTIAAGRLHVLLGANGSGKSTLLSVLAFLHRPSAGRMFFDGQLVEWNASQCAELRRRVTLVHQHPLLFSGSVASNIAFGLKARGIRGERAARIVAASLAEVGLAGFATRNARRLSGGESRRVALARALACRPEVLLLDEPLAEIDRASAALLESLIVARVAAGMTIVLSSHDAPLASKLGARVIHLEEGQSLLDTESHGGGSPAVGETNASS